MYCLVSRGGNFIWRGGGSSLFRIKCVECVHTNVKYRCWRHWC